MVFENLMALHIAIEKNCAPETAFKYLDKYLNNQAPGKIYFMYSDADVEDIEKYRSKGIEYKEIASYYGVKPNNLMSMLSIRRKRRSIKYGA